jgi:hypothetical protein
LKIKLPVGVHGSIEILALSVIGVELTLKLRWIGWKTILKHKRTMIKVSYYPFWQNRREMHELYYLDWYTVRYFWYVSLGTHTL